MATKPQAVPVGGRPAVIRGLSRNSGTGNWLHIIPAWIISGVAHAIILALFMLFSIALNAATPPTADLEALNSETAVEDPADKADLTNPDIGINPEVPLNYNADRIEDVSVPGPVDPTQAIGVPGAPADAPVANVP